MGTGMKRVDISENYSIIYVTSYHYNMFTYLEEPDVLRSDNSENSIKIARSWQKVKYGFRTVKPLQEHLRLYQAANYLDSILG